jgi:hypothetical protein
MPDYGRDPQVVPYLLYLNANAAFNALRSRILRRIGSARAAGADVSEISIRAGRVRSYSVDDIEGHRWYFSEPL